MYTGNRLFIDGQQHTTVSIIITVGVGHLFRVPGLQQQHQVAYIYYGI
jgi:hypothetical protein